MNTAANPFGGLNTTGLEQNQDRLGGSYILDTGAYDATVKVAYAIESANGAKGVSLIADINGREYRETVYVTNRQGENFFLNRDDKSKKVPLPGFTTIEDICLCTTEKPLSEQMIEEKMVNVYDFDAKKEVPKSVPVLTDLIGQQVTLGIIRVLENKSAKDGNGNYQPIPETREVNNIDKVFHTPTKMTMVEATNGKTEGEFFPKWVERNEGNTQDKRKIKDGEAGTAGRPGQPSTGAPQASATPARASLFGKK